MQSNSNVSNVEPAGLCDVCKAIDLDQVLQQDIRIDRGVFVADLGKSPDQLKGSGCPLCRLFADVAPTAHSNRGLQRTENCHLRAFSANRAFSALSNRDMQGINDVVILGVIRVDVKDANAAKNDADSRIRDCLNESGYLCSDQSIQAPSILKIRQSDQRSYNIEFVKSRLTYCQSNHRPTCCVSGGSELHNLRMIDCENGHIIRAPQDCQFVALSYVWGLSRSSASHDLAMHDLGDVRPASIPRYAPKVIWDSIEVVLQLGLRYLWIDRYCIDQFDQDHRDAQIQQMDLIYANALCTLVAAAGQDPHYGLPGVRDNPRIPHPALTVGRHRLISTLPSITWATGSSTWASRGWTYQEELLSNRLVIFTDHQVYYECKGMHGAECISIDLDKFHIKSRKRFRSIADSGLKTPGTHPWEIMVYISFFNKRELTFPGDSLNAMQGIFNKFASSLKPVYQIMGVSIPPPLTSLRGRKSYVKNDRSAEECFAVGLSWWHRRPGHRRREFPSWSWAGWSGTLAEIFDFSESSSERIDHLEIYIENDNRLVTRFPSWDSLGEFLNGPYSKPSVLYLECNIVDISIIYLKQESVLQHSASSDSKHLRYLKSHGIPEDGYYAKIYVNKETSFYRDILLDLDFTEIEASKDGVEGVVEPRCVGILFQDSEFGSVMVAEDKCNSAERVGFLGRNFLICHQGFWAYDENAISKRSRSIPKTKRKIRLE